MPLLMIEDRTRRLVYLLVDVGAVTEDAGGNELDEARQDGADLEAESEGELEMEE